MQQRSMVWHNGQLSDQTISLDKLPSAIPAGDLVWLDLTEPGNDDLQPLVDRFHLDAHTIEDALAAHERPKIVRIGDYSFLTASLARLTGGHVHLSRISAYVLPRMVITIRPVSDNAMQDIIDRWTQDPHLVSWGTKGLLQGLLDVLVDQQFDVLSELDVMIDSLAKGLFSDDIDLRHLQRRTFLLRTQLTSLHRVVPQTRDIVASVIRLSYVEEWPIELRTYYEDVNDHVLRASEWIDSLRDLIASIFQASLALNDSRMNTVMKKLAGWAAIIAVPTLITGWFGMNVPFPGHDSWPGVLVAAGLALCSAVGLYCLLRRKGWL
jgi:magnesium transporter